MVLTPAGEAVLPLARRMLADMESARTAVAELVGLQRGRVRVGATPSLCVGVIADVLRTFHGRHPAIALELAEGGSQLLVESLQLGEIDVALVVVPAGGLAPGLELTPVLRERLSVASPSTERPPSSRGSMTVRELARRSLVVPRRGYDVREVTLAACAEAGVAPRFAVEGGEMDAVLRLVEAGTGVAVVPDIVFAGRPRLLRTALTPALYRTVALARRADLVPSQAAQAFRDTLLEHLRSMSATGGFVGDVQVLGRTAD
jgi:DNA-binding transcriptional LysR family regulator